MLSFSDYQLYIYFWNKLEIKYTYSLNIKDNYVSFVNLTIEKKMCEKWRIILLRAFIFYILVL